MRASSHTQSRRAKLALCWVFAGLWFAGGTAEIFFGTQRLFGGLLILGGLYFSAMPWLPTRGSAVNSEADPQPAVPTDLFIGAPILVALGIFGVLVSWPADYLGLSIGSTIILLGIAVAWRVARRNLPHNKALNADVE